MPATLERRENQSSAQRVLPKSMRAEWIALASIAAFWLTALLFVGISGDFPLNDDWIYAESVQHFLQTGEIRLLACAPACLFQILSSALVCKVFGFSNEVLRALGFFWAVVASFALYASCRLLRLQALPSALLTLCYAANPLFLCLAFSFMTDTPAIALTLAYGAFLLKALKDQKESSFMLSSLCLLAATCVRQNLGFLALVNALLLLLMWTRKRHSWTLLIGLIAAPLAVGYLADKWMLSTNDFTSLYVWYKGMVAKQISLLLHTPGRVLPTIMQIAGELLCYLGLFTLPILLCFLPVFARLFGNRSRINPAFPLVSSSLIVFSLCRFIIGEKRWMPFSQNLLRMPELGAHTILGINQMPLSNKLREALTWTSGVAGFMLGTVLLDTFAQTAVNGWRCFRSGVPGSSRRFGNLLTAVAAISIFAFQFAFTCLQSTFSDIDRYYLFPLLGCCLCLALAWR
ncbi:MAG: glycosyltransferase family 39 protein, partial [Candidatus Obscuribacterales bacterium]|nr:glycosyltransferase family 39 protein [Candidatus Obscuribacterales bacterium]